MNAELGNNPKIQKVNLMERIMRIFADSKKNFINEELELIECIEKARNEWEHAYSSFESAKENEIIDYYIYNMKACQVKYEYLLRKAKKKGIKMTACMYKVN